MAASACHDGAAGMNDAGSNPATIISNGNGSAFEAETTIAASRDGIVAAVWMALSSGCFPSIGYAISPHAGTWSSAARMDAPGGRRSEDPSIAVDAQGSFYLAWLGTKGGTDMHIYVARLDAGPGSFGAPVDVSGGSTTSLVDYPRLAIHAAGNLLFTLLDRRTN